MFAIVRTGGKQYRVAAGDKIVVEKLAGEAGDSVTLGDVLLAGDGGELKSTDGLTVAAEIIAQAKADKVIVFKKRRRHNYRRKAGHRQQHTILQDRRDRRRSRRRPRRPKAEAAPVEAEKPAGAARAPKAEAPAKGGARRGARGEGRGAEEGRRDRRRRPPRKAPAKKASTKKPAADKNA